MTRRLLVAALAAAGVLATAGTAWAGDYYVPPAEEPDCVEVGGDDPLLTLCLDLDLDLDIDDDPDPADTDEDDLIGELLYG